MSDLRDVLQFMKRIEAEPGTASIREVFADWLEERGLDDEAQEQRKKATDIRSGRYAAELRMSAAAKRFMPFYENPKVGIDALLEAANGSVSFYGSSTDRYELLDQYPEFWEDVELLTGKKLDDAHREDTTFRCYC